MHGETKKIIKKAKKPIKKKILKSLSHSKKALNEAKWL